MSAVIIDGKQVAASVKEQVRLTIEREKIKAGLAVIIVGDDSASKVYVRNKKLACEACNIASYEYALPAGTSEEKLLALIDELNGRSEISGILVQQPLPKHIDGSKVNLRILPGKDVDAFHPENVGKIMTGGLSDGAMLPCTPAGVMKLLEFYEIPIAGKNCVVIGRSDIVGKPMAMLLLHAHGTVTICHSRTADLRDVTKNADILVSAVGKVNMVTADMIKDGAVVIDVGMNRDVAGKLCGDADYAVCLEKAGYITPVPGGVGPMTVAMLMQNTLTAAKK